MHAVLRYADTMLRHAMLRFAMPSSALLFHNALLCCALALQLQQGGLLCIQQHPLCLTRFHFSTLTHNSYN